jgi:hypothetical protein
MGCAQPSMEVFHISLDMEAKISEFLRISMYLLGSSYSCELIWIITRRKTSKCEVVQVSAGQLNDIFV